MARVRHVFTGERLTSLRVCLGDKFDQLLPILERTARDYYHDSPVKKEHHARANRHADAAQRLNRASTELDQILKEIPSLVSEAHSLEFVPSDRVSLLPGLPLKPGHTFHDFLSQRPTLQAALSARVSLQVLKRDAQLWRKNAKAAARRKPGRKIGNRILLAAWVGHMLRQVGLKLSTHPNDVWAQAFSVMCDTVRIDSLPTDVGRDLRKAFKIIQADDQRTAESPTSR